MHRSRMTRMFQAAISMFALVAISPATLAACDRVARIPMAPGVDSLNVGVAAAVCLHRFSTGRRT